MPAFAGMSGDEQSHAALYRLMAWLSPAYPVGAFSYSSGIEWAVESGDITDAASFRRWLDVVIASGSAFCDAVLFVHAHRAAAADDARRCARSPSLRPPSCPRRSVISKRPRRAAPSSRRRAPHGHARRSTGSLQAWDGPVAYPVAVGVAAAGHGIALEPALSAYLHAVTANLISAGVRLIPLGQTDGQRLLAALEPTVAATAARALATPLDQVGGAAFRADIASMRHETQYTRLFRS